MFFATSSIFYFTLFNTLVQITSLVEKPVAQDNYIVTTETVIRNTINSLFSSLKYNLDLRKPKVKKYSVVHNFFVSITLQDHDNLKEIARLTKLAKVDNGIDIFITQLNEVLNEDNKSDEATDAVYVTTLIGTFLEGIEYLKEQYGLNNNVSIFDVNKDVLEHLRAGEHFYENITNTNAHNGTLIEPLSPVNSLRRRAENGTDDQDEFWRPTMDSGRRIYNGQKVKIKKFPFMASVQFFKKFQCGGSIIKSDLIITSASCLQLAWNNRFFRENPSFLSVQVGSDFYETGDENIPIQELYFHPSYNPKNLRHNLAILRLLRLLEFTAVTKKVKKIGIDRSPYPLPGNVEKITIVGWGARSTSNILKSPWVNRLAFADLEFYPLLECQDIYSKEFVTDRHFCAGFFSKGAGACNRDAGGPGVVNGILYGVVSFGSPVCGATDAPTVFTKLGYYTDWIDNILEMVVPRIGMRTTTRSHNNLLTYALPFKNEYEWTTIANSPVYDHKTSPEPEPIIIKHDRLRTQKKVFKDFLSTMFESNQIDEYLDQAVNTKDEHNDNSEPAIEKDATRTKHKQKLNAPFKNRFTHKSTTTIDDETDTEEEPKQVTVLDKDMESLKLEDLDNMQDMILKSHHQSKPPKSSKKPVSSNEDKKLEDVIVSLIDNLDIQNILESKSDEKGPDASQEDPKETLAKALRNQRPVKENQKQNILKTKSHEKGLDSSQEDTKETLVLKLLGQKQIKQKQKPVKQNQKPVKLKQKPIQKQPLRKQQEKEKKPVKHEQETAAPPTLDQATIKEIAKVMNMDESVLTFLYLNNMKSKQNETIKKKDVDLNILKHKGGFKIKDIKHRHDDSKEDAGEDLASDEIQDIGEEFMSDSDDEEANSDDESEALSIEMKTADKPSEKRIKSKNVLDLVMANDEDIYEKLLKVVEKEAA